MNKNEYWIGEDVDYQLLWNAYEGGLAYIEKFRSMRVHLLRIELAAFPSDLPLFNHEVVYKTIKGYFHDFKHAILTREEYQSAGPLFLYSVDRGSGIWKFLGELRLIVAFATTLAAGKVLGDELEGNDQNLQILQQYFPDAINPADLDKFTRAKLSDALRLAVGNLLAQEIRHIGVSQRPFEGKIKQTEKTIINIGQIIVQGDQIMSENVGRDKIGAHEGGVAIGGDAHVTKSDFKQIWRGYRDRADLKKLAQELADLRSQMRKVASTPEQDIAIGQLAEAEVAAEADNGPAVLKHLRNAGKWALEFAIQVGATLTAEAMKQAMSL